MVLAEKIIMLRKRKGWTQEELAEQLDISRQSVSKWESGASVPDLDKIIKMSSLFDVTTDYLLKDETGHNAFSEDSERFTDNESIRSVTMDEANEYIDIIKNISKKIAAAVSILILSPVCLIQLGGFAEYRTDIITENMAGGIGASVLLVLVAVGVAILILNGMRLSKYEYFEKEDFILQNGVGEAVEEKKNAYEDKFRINITAGVVLCILGVVPLIMAAGFNAGDFAYVTCVNIMLVFIALGVNFFVHSGMINESFQKLLQNGDYTKENKQTKKKLSAFPAAYWCTVTGIYLGVSLYSSKWDITWIIWPVAGVLFAALYAVLSIIVKLKNK